MSITQVTNNLIQTNTIPRNKLAFSSLTSGGGAFRNKLINGAMEIDQRLEGIANTINNSTGYIADRWLGGAVGGIGTGTASIQNVVDGPTGLRRSIKYTVTGTKPVLSSNDYFGIWQNVESNFLGDLFYGGSSAKTTTLSFWVKSSVAGTYSGRIYAAGSSNRVYIFTYTVNSTNTWEFKTITISSNTTTSLITNNSLGLQLFFSLGHGSAFDTTNINVWQGGSFFGTPDSVRLISTLGATFQITGAQFEVGTTATGFESLPPALELQRCQRYFLKSYASGTVPGTATTTGMIAANTGLDIDTAGTLTPPYRADLPLALRYPVTMRNIPTLVYYNPYVTNTTGAALLGGSKQFSIWFSVGPGAYPSVTPRPQQDENGMGLQYLLGNASNIAVANAVYVFHYTAESEI